MKQALFGFIGVTLALLAIVAVAEDQDNGATRRPAVSVATSVSHFQSSAMRAVRITDRAQVSHGTGPVLVQIVYGEIPADVKWLTVLSDENCTPDSEGVSHCLNRVQFKQVTSVGEAVLQHRHKMSEESCLAPGEVVAIAA
jgi:hypothetical protein